MGYVFDAVVIVSGNDGGTELAELGRPVGPLESGTFDPAGDWVPNPEPQPLTTQGFGVDAITGAPYYDTEAVSDGEHRELWCDPSTVELWLQAP